MIQMLLFLILEKMAKCMDTCDGHQETGGGGLDDVGGATLSFGSCPLVPPAARKPRAGSVTSGQT